MACCFPFSRCHIAWNACAVCFPKRIAGCVGLAVLASLANQPTFTLSLARRAVLFYALAAILFALGLAGWSSAGPTASDEAPADPVPGKDADPLALAAAYAKSHAGFGTQIGRACRLNGSVDVTAQQFARAAQRSCPQLPPEAPAYGSAEGGSDGSVWRSASAYGSEAGEVSL